MEHGATTALAVRVDQIVDRRIEPHLRQRPCDQVALPITVVCRGQMLQRAAAASREMRTDWRDAFAAGDVDLDEMAAVGMAGPRLDLDRFAGKGLRHIDRTGSGIGDTIAARADPRDDKPLNHGTRR